MTDATNLYDCLLNGLGYLVDWGREDAYLKVGADTIVEERDSNVEELSENKLDGLHWSSQRSWFNGGKQTRLDAPASDPEKYLVAKNIDTNERGAASLSRAFAEYEQSSPPAASVTQVQGMVFSHPDLIVWAAASASTTIRLRSVGDWGDPTPAIRNAFAAGNAIEGLTSDGQYIYASNHSGANPGIMRGTLSQTTTALVDWDSATVGPIRDIVFLKERIMGWADNTGQVVIKELGIGASPTLNPLKTYAPGWSIRRTQVGQDVFAEIGGYIAWVICNGPDGYLWLWDGTEEPFAAARFPNIETLGVVSYANEKLYVLGRFSASSTGVGSTGTYDSAATFDDASVAYDEASTGTSSTGNLALIECQVDSTGGVVWDVLYTLKGSPYPRFVVRNREILFPVALPEEERRGLTEDDGVAADGQAYAIAAINVASRGLNVGRYWGLTENGVTTAQLWGDDGYTAPQLASLRGDLGVVGEDGLIRREASTYAPLGEIVSPRIDLNVDSPKVFFLGQASFDPLSGEEVTLQYTFDGVATEAPTFTTIETATAGESIRQRLLEGGLPGPQSVAAHYRVQLAPNADTSDTPVLREAGLGVEPTIKPRYDHVFYVKAFDSMKLRNQGNWPGNRSPDTIQTELETLRDNQSVITFREPIYGRDPRAETYVQVRQLEVTKRKIPGEGGGAVIAVRLRELPS